MTMQYKPHELHYNVGSVQYDKITRCGAILSMHAF
jgi:hypothetical protein